MESYFTEEFVFRCEGLSYDPDIQMVQDSLKDNLEVEGTDNLPGFNRFKTTGITEAHSKERITKTFMPTDNDSISTIGSRFSTPNTHRK